MKRAQVGRSRRLTDEADRKLPNEPNFFGRYLGDKRLGRRETNPILFLKTWPGCPTESWLRTPHSKVAMAKTTGSGSVF